MFLSSKLEFDRMHVFVDIIFFKLSPIYLCNDLERQIFYVRKKKKFDLPIHHLHPATLIRVNQTPLNNKAYD